MNLQKHERSIRDKLRSHRPEVDTDAIWGSVGAHVPHKRRRRRLFAILFGLMLLVPATYIWYTSSDQSSAREKSKSDLPSIAGNTMHEQDNPGEALKSETQGTGHEQSNYPEISFLGKISRNTKVEDISSTDIPGVPVSNTATVLFGNEHKPSTTGRSVDHPNMSELHLNANPSIDPVTTEQENRTSEAIVHLPVVAFLPFRQVDPFILHDRQKLSLGMNPVRKLKAGSRIIVGFEVGSGLTSASYRTTSDHSKYADFIDAHSNELPNLELNASIRYSVGSGFYIGSGLSASRLATRISGNWEQTEVNTIPGTDTVFIDQNGNISESTGTINERKITRREVVHHTYHYTVNLPLYAGYRLWSNGTFGIRGEAGVVLNLHSASTGGILFENDIYRWDSNADSPYSKFSIGWQAGLMISYRLSPRAFLAAHPTITHRQIRLLYNSIDLEKRLTNFNMRLGAHYQL